MTGGNWAVVEVIGEMAFRLPGIPAETVTKALYECESNEEKRGTAESKLTGANSLRGSRW